MTLDDFKGAGALLAEVAVKRAADDDEEEKARRRARADFRHHPYTSAIGHGLLGAGLGAGLGGITGGAFLPSTYEKLRDYPNAIDALEGGRVMLNDIAAKQRTSRKLPPGTADATEERVRELGRRVDTLRGEYKDIRRRAVTHPLYGALLGAGLGAGYSGLRSYLNV